MITEFAKPSPTACASSSNRRGGNPDSCSEYVPDAFAGDALAMNALTSATVCVRLNLPTTRLPSLSLSWMDVVGAPSSWGRVGPR